MYILFCAISHGDAGGTFFVHLKQLSPCSRGFIPTVSSKEWGTVIVKVHTHFIMNEL